jgi:hypothetical protein
MCMGMFEYVIGCTVMLGETPSFEGDAEGPWSSPSAGDGVLALDIVGGGE